MRKTFRRMLSLLLALVLAAGLSATALADFQYPNEVWPLLEEWTASFNAKDPDRVIAVVQKIYDLLMPYGYNNQVCENLEPKCGIASWCCEMKGDLDGAVTWLERQREMDDWMSKNGYDKKDTLLDTEWRLRYLKTAASPRIYALRQGVSSPYGYGPATGVWYGSVHEGSQTGESAVLAYIDFINGQSASDHGYWINNYMAYSPKFAAAAQGGVMEIAWNFPNLSAVLSAPDSQIAGAASALGAMNCTILLRLGAEMNDGYGVDPAQFIQAFQRIANAVRQYPNIKTVFSPNNISRRDMTFESFYPGDQYVDWIGVSNYHNTNYTTPNSQGPGTYVFDNWERCNAQGYYGEGVYDSDPLIVLQPLAEFAQAHNKPMMISEGGYGYHTADNAAQNAYAVDQVHKFYSYVCMVYPQVKAVFYFDQNVAGDSHNYLLSGNSAIDNAYKAAIAGNGAYLAQGQTSGSNWVELSQAGAVSGTVRLGTYASFPGKDPTSVNYYVDGKQVGTVGRAPFYFDLDTSTLTPGKHTVRAEAASGKFRRTTAEYELNVAEAPVTGFQPESAAEWARPQMQQAHDLGLLTGRTENRFQSQVTRLQFAELAVNLAERATGQSIAPAPAGTFTDTNEPAVLKASAAGIAGGRGAGTFDPSGSITRQEICIMLNNTIRYVDSIRGTSTLSNPSTQMSSAFPDAGTIDSWALEAVALMTNNGIMNGANGSVAPKANTTVQEAVVLILRLNERFSG